MTDDLSPRETARELDRLQDRVRSLENRVTDSLRAYDDRLTRLAAEMVPIREVTELRADVAKLEQAMADDIRDVRGELRRAADRVESASRDQYAQAKEATKAVSDRLDETVRAWRGRGELTWQRILAIGGIIATLLAALITVVLSGKGIH